MDATTRSAIEEFLLQRQVAVVGASDDPRKFGHRVFVALQQHGRYPIPVNPNAATVTGQPTVPDLRSLKEPVSAVSIITPPAVTERVVVDAIAAGVKLIWMQPGAESPAAVQQARDAGIQVIAGGPCLLVALRGLR